MKHIIPILIALLLLSSGFVGVSNTAEEQWVDAEDTERDEFLDDLAFYCLDASGSNAKYEYYKEQMLNDVVIDEVEKDIVEPLKTSPSNIQSSGPMNSAWPMQSRNTHHTGRSPYSAIDTCAEIWRFYTDDGQIAETPVIDSDGVIYFGSFNWYFYAVNPDGTEKWKYKTDGEIWGSSAAINEDGTIYVGSWDYGGNLYAIKPDGALKWKFPANGASISSSPAIADDGTIYFGTMWSLGDGGKIHAVNLNGTEKWQYQTGWHISSDPAIGDDGTVYIGSGDTYLYALWPNGTLRWRFKTGDEIHGHPSIANDGTIYIGSWDDYLYALYPNGTMKWKVVTGWGTSNCQAIGEDGTIYVGTDRLRAFYPNGTLKWSFNFGANKYVGKSSPAVSADGTIYIGTHYEQTTAGEIIAVNPDGTERWRKKIANDWVDSSPSIGDDGTVYIGSSSSDAGYTYGYLYAFGVGELEADADGPYYGLIDIPVQFTGTSSGGYSPYSYHWNFGDGNVSDEQNPTHIYTTPDNFTIMLTVTDNSSNTSDDTTWAWIQTSNDPPNKPSIDGETNGKVGVEYEYTFETTDPEGLQVWYYIEWGDGSDTGWIGPYPSNVEVIKSHSWSEKDTYTIRCKAKDPYESESDWGELEVIMPMKQQMWYLRWLERFPLLNQIIYLLMDRWGI